MAVEMGAKCGIFEADKKVIKWVEEHSKKKPAASGGLFLHLASGSGGRTEFFIPWNHVLKFVFRLTGKPPDRLAGRCNL